jgi:chromosome partitioning protein
MTEVANFSAAVSAIERSYDFLVIDTPGNDTFLMRLAHSMADTLITPINDSFLDLDVLAALDPVNFAVTGESHHAKMVREARRQRRLTDGRMTDWVVVRNRLSTLSSRNKRLVGEGLTELAKRIGFRWVDGFAERVVYREFFPRGLTALDDLDKATLGTRPSKSHVAARGEVMALLNLLHLPLSAIGKRRAAARAEWYSVMDQPLKVHDVIG